MSEVIPEIEVPTAASEAAGSRIVEFVPPIPMECFEAMCRAADRSPSVVPVAVMIWREGKMQRRHENIRLGRRATDRCGVGRSSRYRALERLQSAGLIAIDQRPGGATNVTLLGKCMPRS